MRFVQISVFLWMNIGCGGPLYFVHQDQAAQIVWASHHRLAYTRPPSIAWVIPPSLDCANGTGWTQYYSTGDQLVARCIAGAGCTGIDRGVEVARWRTDQPFSETSLAHEFWHCALLEATGDMDFFHRDPGFGEAYGHPPGGAVDQANAALKDAGL